MGEVYLARDIELDRTVALKILPAHLASDQQRMRRFMQEAKAASSLNHQNILTIYEIGEIESTRFIATEFIDGVTLRQHLKRGQISLQEVFEIGIQIASGLAAAHEAGIVHRDIKPENIMLRGRDGFVKVLDFGLVKLTEASTNTTDTEAPTRALVNTDAGTVMGTVAYMSPEQARGKAIDERTDIWSLGVILYEMVTGIPPFSGESSADVIAAIVKSEPPPITRFARDAPEKLSEIVSKTLEKDRDDRYQTIKDLLVDLRRLKKRMDFEAEMDRSVSTDSRAVELSSSQDSGTVTQTGSQTISLDAARPTSSAEYLVSEIKRHRLGVILTLLVLVVAVIFAVRYLIKFTATEKPGLPVAMKINKLTSGGRVNNRLIDGSTSISPDGKYVVYTLNEAGKISVWVRQISTGSDVQIVEPLEMRNNGTTISNDGEFVYYIGMERETPGGTLFQVPILGGTPRRILGGVRGPISFSPDGKQFTFVRNQSGVDALMVANEDGSNERTLAVRRGNDWFTSDGPSWSPDGKTIAVGAGTDTGGTFMTVMGYSLSDGTLKPLTSQKWIGAVRRVIWLKDGSGLVLAAVDQAGAIARSQLWFVSYPDGTARRITNDLNGYGGVSLGLSNDSNTIVTVQSKPSVQVWTANISDPTKAVAVTHGEVDGADGLSWLPDGNLIYLTRSGETPELWTCKPDGTAPRRLRSAGEAEFGLSATPDGKYLFSTSIRSGIPQIWRVNADGGDPKQITNGDFANFEPVCSPDSKWVMFSSFRSGMESLWRVSVEGGEMYQITDKPATRATYSADGKFIAAGYFLENEKPPWRLAIMGADGGSPLKLIPPPPGLNLRRAAWTADGRGLIMRSDQGGVSNLWRVPIESGNPQQLTNFTSDLIYEFAVSPDGKRLAMARGTTTLDVILIKDFR